MPPTAKIPVFRSRVLMTVVVLALCVVLPLLGCSAASQPLLKSSSHHTAAPSSVASEGTWQAPTQPPNSAGKKSTPASVAPVIVGVSKGDLVSYDPGTGRIRELVRNVGATGVLAIGPNKDWIAVEEARRWDGLDMNDIVFVNLHTKKIWRLSKQAGRDLHVRPVSWANDTVIYADDGVYSGDSTTGTYVLDLRSGIVSSTSGDGMHNTWSEFSRKWTGPVNVPNPSAPAGVSLAPRFWQLGQSDVCPDGRWAVACLQPGWPAPGVGDWFPVYLLSRDGAYRRCPLERPAVFESTLNPQ